MSYNNSDYYFLKSGGEMGELIRAKDWSKTALGDPADWPQSLCTTVAIMLDNPFGMYIAWGSEYTQLYNDGYRPILGATKHPQALGISTRETFSEIWHIIESMFDGVMKGKAVGFPDFMLPLNRNGFVEECYFDFAYSPIRTDNGEVGGILVTVAETTEKKRATEALKESNARYINNIMQAPVAMCVFRGKNHVVEIANEKMLHLWGKQAEQVMNKPIFEGLPESKNQGLEELIDKVYTTGEKFVANERPVSLPRNGKVQTTYVNFVYEALKEASGTISGIIATATEVTDQIIARQKIEESEKQLQNIFRNAPVAIAIYEGSEYKYILANKGYEKLTNRKEGDLLGKRFKDVFPELKDTGTFEIYDQVFKTGEPFIFNEYPAMVDIKNDGVLRQGYFNFSMEPLKNDAGEIYAVVAITYDITEQVVARKKIEESETLHRQIFEFSPVAIWEKDDTDLYREIELLKQKGIKDFRKYLDQNTEEIFRLVSLVKLEDVNIESVDLFQAASKQEVITSFHKLFTEESVPMLKEGIISVAENKKRLTVASVLQSLKGKRLDILISFDFRIGNDLNKSLVSLTDITEQVEAHKKIEANEIELRKTSEYLEIATNAAEVGIWSLDLASQKLEWSALHKKMWGYDELRSDLVYEDWHKVILTEDKEAAFAEVAKALKTKTLYEAVYRIKRPNDGEVRWMKSSGQYFYNEKDEPVMLTGVSFDITNEKIAEEKLLASEERIRLATKASGVGIWEWNVITNKIRWDAQMFRIYGVAPTADGFVEYSTWSNAVAPEDLSVQEKILQDTVKNDGTSNRNFKIYRANDGMLRFIEAIETVRTNAARQAEWVVGTNLDVTEKLLAQKKVEENEKQFNTLANNIQNLAWMADGEGNIFWYNQRWYDYTGTTFEEMKGWGWEKVHHPDYVDHVVDFVQKAWYINKPFEITFPLRGANGEYRWFLTRAYPVTDDKGKIINWIGTNTDITKEKSLAEQLETQVKERTAELSKLTQTLLEKNESLSISEDFNRSLTEVSPNVVYIHDIINNEPFFLNRTGLSVIGRNHEEALGNKDLQGIIIHPEDLPGVVDIVERIKQTKNNEVFEHEYRIKNAKGNWIPFLARDTVFKRNEKNEVTHLLGIAIDISELKIAEKELLQKNSDLEKMNKELQSFAYISSHDLQEPLRKIQTFATCITEKEENNLSDYGKDMFNRMQASARRMQTLIQDLLAYSSTNTEERKFENTYLNKIVEDVKDDLKEELKDKQATIEATELGEAYIIPFQFRQLLHNLIGNSLKFSNPQRPPRIKIDCEIAKGAKLNNAHLNDKVGEEKLLPQNKYCHITVSDNGIGFEQQYSEKIFEIFQRLHGKEKYKGTGIGLAIVKKIIENHNGIITANGELNKGAAFHIYIPAL